MLGECDDVTEGSRGPKKAESDGGIPLSDFTRQTHRVSPSVFTEVMFTRLWPSENKWPEIESFSEQLVNHSLNLTCNIQQPL